MQLLLILAMFSLSSYAKTPLTVTALYPDNKITRVVFGDGESRNVEINTKKFQCATMWTENKTWQFFCVNLEGASSFSILLDCKKKREGSLILFEQRKIEKDYVYINLKC